MATGFFNWSRTPAVNANATYTWAEGMAPSTVNDSARGIMSDLAEWRDDISGAIATGGTSTAYTVTSYSVFTSLSLMNGQMIAFTPHATSGATVTLNVDGLGAKPLRSAPSVDLPAGVLIQGTPYVAVYNNSDAAFYLHGFYGNPYSLPIGGVLPFTGATAPNSSFVLAYGQAVSRSTYSTYFGMVSTTYGTGDGSTTFNIPDLRGRFLAGADNMGGTAASRLTSTYLGAAGTLGNNGGSQSHTLTAGEIPVITSAVSVNGTLTGTTQSNVDIDFGIANLAAGGNPCNVVSSKGGASVSVGGTLNGSATSNNAGGNPHSIVPPTLIVNYLLRII
ncbi:phage tail protein [Bradyrhizobium diazoefficiens]|uniref:phage tail protein n=1 Tax=Bradyrhizobium diazoefficiens TaxID=1355477 RepID=UPI00347F1A04